MPHDLNRAARYATHLIGAVFGLTCRMIDGPETGTPLVVPAARRMSGVAGNRH